MATKARFKSDAFEAIHGSASALHRVGEIDKATMRDFDAASPIIPPAIALADIKRIRETANVSQPVFARYFNISKSIIEKWETGAKKPSGMALELLTVVQKCGLEVQA